MLMMGDDSYTLPDPELRAYDQGVGTLSVGGEFRGYLASVVRRMTFLPRSRGRALGSSGWWPQRAALRGLRPWLVDRDDAAAVWDDLDLTDEDF